MPERPESFEAFVRRIAPEHAALILRNQETWKARAVDLRIANIELADAMRSARALLHRDRPEPMNAATVLGNALERRVENMLSDVDDSEEGT